MDGYSPNLTSGRPCRYASGVNIRPALLRPARRGIERHDARQGFTQALRQARATVPG